MTMTEVAAGVAYMDETMPGWADLIDIETLDIDNAERCIIGQTHGGTGEEYIRLSHHNNGWIEQHAFCDSASFQAEWVKVISARQNANN